MHSPSDSQQRVVLQPPPQPLQMPLLQFQVNQTLAFAQWATAMWVLGQTQFSRLSTLLVGGVPIDV